MMSTKLISLRHKEKIKNASLNEISLGIFLIFKIVKLVLGLGLELGLVLVLELELLLGFELEEILVLIDNLFNEEDNSSFELFDAYRVDIVANNKGDDEKCC